VGGDVNILAIETATPACAVALRTNDGFERTLVVDDERHHTEALTPGIERLLIEAGIRAKALERIVVDRGPGLFTGLRVGVATAIGLTLATGAQLVAVTSLEVLAWGASSAGVRGVVVGAVDGRRGEVFTQEFEIDEGVRAISEATVTTPAALVENWLARKTNVTFSGDGATRYEAVLREVATAHFFDQRVPPPSEALRLGATRDPSGDVVPLYLRDADAVANFSTRERPS
jgi:tRNA threonylcarbamoyladenosine biosynthesis protein TsaB